MAYIYTNVILMSTKAQYAMKKVQGSVFFSIFRTTQTLFVGVLIRLLWSSGDVFSGFQSQSGQPYLHHGEAYNGVFPK